MGVVLVLGLAAAAFTFMCHRSLKSFAFPAWVFTFLSASMVWPMAFDHWFGYDLKNLVVPLVQVIMFGMGTKLSAGDFLRVAVMPWPVLVGVTLHYTVMPLAGFTLARVFGFPPEVGAGIILIGSVSSGAASNLIAYLARGNVALAVTVTACSTLMSPVMTPFLMKTLAGRMVPIDFMNMLLEILNIVVVPVVSGLIANRILYGTSAWWGRSRALTAIAGLAAAGVFLVSRIPGSWLGSLLVLRSGAMVGLGLICVVALAKWIVCVLAGRPNTWMDRALPLVSMAGICLIVAIITMRSRDKLMTVGATLVVVAILHNAIGYFFGYWISRLIRLDEITCRTVAIEVGMQNGGMASALAMGVLNSANAALAPAIFGPWMNISGSILASWWRKRPVGPPPSPGAGPAGALVEAVSCTSRSS